MAAVITGTVPATAQAGGAPFTLEVDGTGFTADAAIIFTGAGATTFVSATKLTAPVTPPDVQGTYQLRVMQADGQSNTVNFVFGQNAELLDHLMGLHCISLCNVAPDCVLPTPWPPAPVP